MILRLLISLLLTLGFADTSAAVESTVRIGPDYQTEWFHSETEKSDVHAYPYHVIASESDSPDIQVQLSTYFSNQLNLTFIRQQKLRLLISEHHHNQRAFNLQYPSEDAIYCNVV